MAGIIDRIRNRRQKNEQTDGRRHIMALAAEVFEAGDTADSLGKKLKTAISEEPGAKPWKALLLKLAQALLPLLIQMLTKQFA